MRWSLLFVIVLVVGCYSDREFASGEDTRSGGAAGLGGQGVGGGQTPEEPTSSGGAVGGQAGAAGMPVDPPCDVNEEPDENGLFVSNTADEDGNGSRAFPFKTIDAAMSLGIANRIVYLDQGTHQISVVDGSSTGATLQGGWRRTDGGRWQRDCAPQPELRTRIASDDAVGLRIEDVDITLDTLTIASKAECASSPDAEGESCYGLWIDGAANVHLNQVVVRAGRGGHGGAVSRTVAAPAATCTGSSAACSNGNNGGTGEPGSDAAEPGVFGPSGFLPSGGGDGEPGTEGANGTVGGSGASKTCHTACYCSGASAPSGACAPAGSITVTGDPGRCGCGGRGGAAGGGGLGGGASVAIFVAHPEASLTLTRSWLVAADGGDGSQGASGAAGSSGANGATGNSKSCSTCNGCPCNQVACCGMVASSVEGGSAGGQGGRGGDGGRGGNGAGGPSIGIARAEGSVVQLMETDIELGVGGEGPGDALSGEAHEQVSF